MNNKLKYILVLILTYPGFKSIGQFYSGSIFQKCRFEPLTKDHVCDKTEMINFVHKEILPYIQREEDANLVIKLDFTVNFDGEVYNLSVNDFPVKALLEKTFLFKQYNIVKIPSYKYSHQVSVSYLVPRDRLKDYDFKRITLRADQGEIYKVTEEMPRFPGCEDLNTREEKKKCSDLLMYGYLKENLILPEEIIENNIKGTVVVQFVVEVDGWLDHIQVLRELGHGSAEAAVKVIVSMNEMEEPWIPGKQRGINVRVMYTLPIKFDPD